MKKTWHILLSIVAFFLASVLNVNAQKTAITVLEEGSLTPCVSANVIAFDANDKYFFGGTTDKEGKIELALNERSKIVITFVGYNDTTFFLNPGQNISIQLKVAYFDIENVVVTGQYQPKPVDKSIYKIDVINSKVLQERGVNNLAEALSGETSIRLTVDPSTGTSIKLQGLGGENVKYLIDGIPIVGRVDGNVDLSQIDMENVDHIEIVKGPMSVQYGTSAIAGVINIITKKNNYFRNLIKGNSYVDTKGNYNFGLYGSLIRGNHTITLSGSRNIFQGADLNLNVDEEDADGMDRYMEFKPKLVYNAEAAYAYRKNDFRIGFKSQYMNSLVKNYSNYIEKIILAYDQDFYTTRSTNSITLADKLSESVSYDIVGAYTYFGRETEYITSDLFLLTKEVTHSTFTEFNNIMTRGNLTYTPEGKPFSFSTGWDLNYDNGSGDKIEEGAEIGDYALYLSSQYNPLKTISIQPGIRLIYNTIYGAPFIPSLNLQYELLEKVNFRASYARGFRAPSLKELYLDFKDSNHDLSGNKELKAETTNSYNASISYKLNLNDFRIKFDPGFFYNDGKDAITLIVTNVETNSATNVNLGGRRTLGGEFNSSVQIRNGLYVSAGLSRIGETYDYDGTGEYVPIVYYNNYSFNTKYTYSKLALTFMLNAKIYGKTPSLAVIPEENGGGFYRVYTDPYGDIDLTITKSFWNNKLDMVLGAKNLLNNISIRNYGYRDYGQIDFTPERYNPKNYGRVFFIKLNLKLNS